MSKQRKPKSAGQIQTALQKAKEQLERADKRLARLQNLSDRLSVSASMSERARAVLGETVDEWVAEFREAAESDKAAVNFQALGVDFLLVDEAQNFKNLWPVDRREGGVPKYLGAISEGSDRAMDLAIRAFLVQKNTGGSGVALLSATPAKNSPLEFFTLLGFVDHYCWTRRSIFDADSFIDRYLRLENRSSLKPDGTLENRSAVVGFRSLPDLRDLVFRYGDFRDATDVGLVLPKTETVQIFLPMNAEQQDKYRVYRNMYEKLVTSRMSTTDRYKALGILQRMAQVALHPALDSGPIVGPPLKPGGEPQRRWTWENADQLKNYESPKLVKAVELVLEKPNCGHILFVESVALHRWLQRVLIERGIAPERIAILNAHEAPKALQRQEIAEAFNGQAAIYDDQGHLVQEEIAPKYDVVIANSIAYEGTDLQARTCRIYQLDLPLEPATVQQRNGRAVRQGNMQAVVEVFYLLSEKSYDAIKLGMITGKLRWMSDILKGADRETANPAAGMDLSVEDMLLFLADDPVAAKAAMAEIQRKNEQDRRRAAAERGWVRVTSLINYIRFAMTREEEAEREVARAKVKETADYLLAIPPDIWPWQFVLERVLAGTPTLVLALVVKHDEQADEYFHRPVWEGMQLAIPGRDRWITFGKVQAGGYSFREDGSYGWQRHAVAPTWLEDALRQTPPAAFGNRAVDDSSRWRTALKQAIPMLRSRGLESIGFQHAPDYWIAAVWQEFASQIIVAMSDRYVLAPVRSGSTVAFKELKPTDDVLPPTDAGFAELIGRVQRGSHLYGPTQDAAQEWWGRNFPRGVADPRELLELRDESGTTANYRVEGAAQKGWGVAEVQLGMFRIFNAGAASLVGPAFSARLDAAKLAVRWLAFQHSDAVLGLLDDGASTLLRWILAQSALPSLAEVQARNASSGM